MSRLLSLIVASASAIGCAHPPQSQTDSSFDFVSLPTSLMACRPVPVTSVDSAAFAFELVDYRKPVERTTFFAYDSSGSAIYATTTATAVFNDQGDGWADMAAMRFIPERERSGTHVRRRYVASVIVPDSSNGVTKMTSEELSRARTLGDWIWKHRCARDTTGPRVAPATL